MKVAVLYYARPAHRLPGAPDDAFEEYDSPDTIAAIAAALARIGVAPVPVVADQRLPWRLDEGRFDFVFNIAEGSGRRCREALPAAVCELLRVPFTGSDALTLAVTLDKAVARRVVSPDVAVARAVLVSPPAGARGYPVARLSGGWCVFFNEGCVLHRLGADEGDRTRYKPTVCALFPLDRLDGDRWYVRQRGYDGERWELACLDPRVSVTPAAESLREEMALAERVMEEEA
jgi:hypothetical protein